MQSISSSSSRSPSKLTGERPRQGVTPDSLLALHEAGYGAVLDRLGPGAVLDVGCGEGFESARLMGEGRRVVGIDYSEEATRAASALFGPEGMSVACMDALTLGLGDGTFDWACSSHVIEHFTEPERHVAEVSRVLTTDGSAFFLTPNEPADFENPFHVHLFGRKELSSILEQYFEDVWIGGLDAVARVKEDLSVRRAKAARLLALDVFDIRHKIPHRWYVALYMRLLPMAYRLLARRDVRGMTGIVGDDFFVTDMVDDTTLVLFAVACRPRRAASLGLPERS